MHICMPIEMTELPLAVARHSLAWRSGGVQTAPPNSPYIYLRPSTGYVWSDASNGEKVLASLVTS
jgi:hypothetical protein